MATQRYLIFFSYLGSAFRGSQYQVGCETVQRAVEKSFKEVFKADGERPIRVLLASRTDTGVHALKAALSVDLPKYKQCFLEPASVKSLMNAYFKKNWDIRISEVHTVPDTFKLLKSRVDKIYLYRVGILKKEFFKRCNINVIPILEYGRAELIRTNKTFDLKKIEEALPLFEGKKDFGAILGRPSHNIRPTVCNIISFTVERAQPHISIDPITQNYDFYHFLCKGDRFLYHMVRRMVGLALSVGFSDITLADIKKLFDEPVPSSWPKGFITPTSGCGLYLVNTNIDFQSLEKDMLLESRTKVDQIKSFEEVTLQ